MELVGEIEESGTPHRERVPKYRQRLHAFELVEWRLTAGRSLKRRHLIAGVQVVEQGTAGRGPPCGA